MTDSAALNKDLVIVIMGVTAAGKSRIARHLAHRTGWPMEEGDDYHPSSNVAKMRDGEPLTDEDRMPWIDALAEASNQHAEGPVIISCSALNNNVRLRLASGMDRSCRWILLDVPMGVLEKRMNARSNHFMPASLLSSQIDAMVAPDDAVRIDGTMSPDRICMEIVRALNKKG